MDIHPRSRINCFRLCSKQLSAGRLSGECDLLGRVFHFFLCLRLSDVATFYASLLSLRADLEQNQHWPNNQHTQFAILLLPALSSVLQIMGASHSSSSIVDAIALARTYLDWLTNWWMTGKTLSNMQQLRLLLRQSSSQTRLISLLTRINICCAVNKQNFFH